MTTRRAKREKQTSDNISWPRNVIYSHFLAKKCYHVTFLGQEMLSASGVGDHISSSRNCDTDNGYKQPINLMPESKIHVSPFAVCCYGIIVHCRALPLRRVSQIELEVLEIKQVLYINRVYNPELEEF